jgi:hypothetical protein
VSVPAGSPSADAINDRLLRLFPDADQRARALVLLIALPSDQRSVLLSFNDTAVRDALQELESALEEEQGAPGR